MELTDRRSFQARLQEVMEERGLNQAEVAKAARVNQSSVHDWLNPSLKALPKARPLIRLCVALNVSADWLLMGRGAKEGGLAPLGDQLSTGAAIAIRDMRGLLDELEAGYRGKAAPVSRPAHPGEEAAAADQAQRAVERAVEVRGTPGVRKQPRRQERRRA